MKKLFAIAALLVGSLAAAAGASAQTVPSLFRDSSGNSFTAADVYSFQCATGGYQVQFTTEYTVLFFADNSGICTRWQNSPYVQANFIQSPGVQRWINGNQVRRAYNDGGNTKVMRSGGPVDTTAGTALLTIIQNRSN